MKLKEIFRSHMVFACHQPIRIFGSGKGRAEITFANVSKTVTSEQEQWLVEFPPMECDGPYELRFASDEESVSFTDIYVGEVYLFAGQSNMQFKVKDGEDDLGLCETNEMLRMFSTDRIEKTDYFTPKDGWVKAEKHTAPEWSALAHFAGAKLVRERKIAIGIVVAYQGASVIESWVPEGILEENDILLPRSEKGKSHFDPRYIWNKDGTLYENMMCQIKPFSFTGIVWYQGESDTTLGESKVYGKELAILIDTWRKDFQNPALPFTVIQIADLKLEKPEAWTNVQKAQYNIQFAIPDVTTVISADVCADDDIHPPRKYLLAQRLADTLMKTNKGE